MTEANEIPQKCHECARPVGPAINTTCDYCGRMEFYEETLCDLNRCAQDSKVFSCSAFQPILRVVNSSTRNISRHDNKDTANSRERFFENLLNTDKYKYMKALAFQMLEANPDEEIINLRYHMVWNVAYRKPIFRLDSNILDFVHNMFQENSTLLGGFVYLLWLAKDHIHIFIESDGKDSVETIINKIKQFSSNAILNRFPNLKEGFADSEGIWDESYFVETVQ